MDLNNAEELARECEQTKDPQAKAALLNEFLTALESLPSREQKKARQQARLRSMEYLAKANRIMERLESLKEDILAKAAKT